MQNKKVEINCSEELRGVCCISYNPRGCLAIITKHKARIKCTSRCGNGPSTCCLFCPKNYCELGNLPKPELRLKALMVLENLKANYFEPAK